MECNQIKTTCNIEIISASDLLGKELDTNEVGEIKALLVLINETETSQTDIQKLCEKIEAMPVITIGVFKDNFGENALKIGNSTHLRVAISSTKCDIKSNNLLKDRKMLCLLGTEGCKKYDNLHAKIEDVGILFELNYVSKVFQSLEDDEFEQWVKSLLDKKSKEQLAAIKSCYDKYRSMMPKTNDKGILALEESKKFCTLAVGIYEKSRLAS